MMELHYLEGTSCTSVRHVGRMRLSVPRPGEEGCLGLVLQTDWLLWPRAEDKGKRRGEKIMLAHLSFSEILSAKEEK